MDNDKDRHVQIIDGIFIDCHLLGVAQQFRELDFSQSSRATAINNLFYFVAELCPDVWDKDFKRKPDKHIFDSISSAKKFANKFGRLQVFKRNDKYFIDNEAPEDREAGRVWCGKIGNLDHGNPAYAKTEKAAVIMAVIQLLSEIFHEYYKPRPERVTH